MVKQVQGQFNLDKILADKRRSPKQFVLPSDRDILITDQHTERTAQGDLMRYTRVVGVAENVQVNDGKLEFDWIPTDPGMKNLIDNSKHPTKLFKYSPEHIAQNTSKEYPQGEVGLLRSIAITNVANDEDAITTKIKNTALKIFKGDEEMKEEDIKAMIDSKVAEEVAPFKERAELLEKLEGVIGKVDKIDVDKLEEVIGMIPNLQKIPELEKNIKGIVKDDSEEWEKLVKNVKHNGGLEEETLQKMSISELKALDERFSKNSPGAGISNSTEPEDIVAQINAEYGTHIGEKAE